jgi:hypothetical protein
MSAPKIFILVLILLAVLFAVGAGMGVFGNDGDAGPTQEKWRHRLENVFGGQEVLVRPDEIQERKSPFRSPSEKVFVVPLGPELEFSVRGSEQRMRSLELTLQDGGKARVQWIPAGETNAPLDLPMYPGKPVKLRATKEGGRLILSCKQGVGMPPMVRVMMK